jgi:hypothetical protein
MPANLDEHAVQLPDWLYASYNSADPSSDIAPILSSTASMVDSVKLVLVVERDQ